MRTHRGKYVSKYMTMLVPMFLLLSTVFETKLSPAASSSPVIRTFPHYQGVASWYGKSSPCIKRHTANGEIFNDKKATCASWHFPIGTHLKVTNTKNGRSVICRVNDRGPKRSLNRAIDLSRSSFKKIADPKRGLVDVAITPIYF